MSKQHRSFLLVSLVTAFLLASIFAVVQAQEGKSPAVKQTRWSDAATWPDRKVPAAGDRVTILFALQPPGVALKRAGASACSRTELRADGH